MILPETLYGKLTLLATLIESVVIITLQSVIAAVFLKYYDDFGGVTHFGSYRGIPVYLVIFILAQIFAIVLCWDAVSFISNFLASTQEHYPNHWLCHIQLFILLLLDIPVCTNDKDYRFPLLGAET